MQTTYLTTALAWIGGVVAIDERVIALAQRIGQAAGAHRAWGSNRRSSRYGRYITARPLTEVDDGDGTCLQEAGLAGLDACFGSCRPKRFALQ